MTEGKKFTSTEPWPLQEADRKVRNRHLLKLCQREVVVFTLSVVVSEGLEGVGLPSEMMPQIHRYELFI